MDAHDRTAALRHVDQALAIDPAFLAAQTLRERIIAGDLVTIAASPAGPVTAAGPPLAPVAVVSRPAVPPEGIVQFEARARQRRLTRRLTAATEAIGRGEFAEARAALDEACEIDPANAQARMLLVDLAAAERARERPVRADGGRRRPARWLAAAAALAAILLGASWLEDPGWLRSHPIEPTADSRQLAADATNATSPGVATTGSVPAHADRAPDLPAGDTPRADELAGSDVTGRPADLADQPKADRVDDPTIRVAESAPAIRATPDPSSATSISPVPEPQPASARPPASPVFSPGSSSVGGAGPTNPPPAPVEAAATAVPGQPAVSDVNPRDLAAVSPLAPPASTPSGATASASASGAAASPPPETAANRASATPPVTNSGGVANSGTAANPTNSGNLVNPVNPVSDEQLVKQALQRYRAAYEDLDAGRAHLVYPAVNEAALERAFQGLESQRLTFDTCDVQLRGAAANAVCRGTTQYVPKIGSREPHTEARTWNFTLRKAGDAWQIENARANR